MTLQVIIRFSSDLIAALKVYEIWGIHDTPSKIVSYTKQLIWYLRLLWEHQGTWVQIYDHDMDCLYCALELIWCALITELDLLFVILHLIILRIMFLWFVNRFLLFFFCHYIVIHVYICNIHFYLTLILNIYRKSNYTFLYS